MGVSSIPMIPNLGECLMPNLSLLHSLEVAQKFLWWRFQRLYGEVPEIIWCLNVNIVIGFGPNLDLALLPRAKLVKIKHLGGSGTERLVLIRIYDK